MTNNTNAAEATEAVETGTDETEATFVPNTPESTIASMRAIYATADQKGKARIRVEMDNAFKAAVRDGNLATAQMWLDARESLATAQTVTKAVDPAETVAYRVAMLRMAANLLESGDIVPNALETGETDIADWSARVVAAVSAMSELGDDDPVRDDVTRDARKVAEAKITRNAPTNRIQDVLDVAFRYASEDPGFDGFLTVAQIANIYNESPEKVAFVYDGPITARLFPKSGNCTLDGYEPVAPDGKNAAGARIAD